MTTKPKRQASVYDGINAARALTTRAKKPISQAAIAREAGLPVTTFCAFMADGFQNKTLDAVDRINAAVKRLKSAK